MKPMWIFLCLPMALLVACGGGSANITNQDRPEFPMRSERVILELETGNLPHRRAVLHRLLYQQGDLVDWKEFWTLMAKSGQRDSLFHETETEILLLRSRSCRSDALGAMGRYLFSIPGAYLRWPEVAHTCATSVETSITTAFAEQVAAGVLSSDHPHRNELLQNFIPPNAPLLDWATFWNHLRSAPNEIQASLVEAHAAPLFSLSRPSCSNEGFPAYVAFARAFSSGRLTFLRPRPCLRPLPAEEVPALVDALFTDARTDHALRHKLIKTVLAEIVAQPRAGWSTIFKSGHHEQINRLLSDSDVSLALDLLLAWQAAEQRTAPFEAPLRSAVLSQPAKMAKVLDERGITGGTEILLQMAQNADLARQLPTLTDSAWLAIEEELLRPHRFVKLAVNETLNALSRVKRTVHLLAVGVSTDAHLKAQSVLSARLIETLSSESKTSLKLVLSDRDLHAEAGGFEGDTVWACYRLIGNECPLTSRWIRDARTSEDAFDQILQTRLRIHLATDVGERLRFSEALCKQLQDKGIRRVTLAADAFKAAFQKGLSAGCYEVESTAPIEVAANSAGGMDDNAVLFAKTPKLVVISSTRPRLSILDLSAAPNSVALPAAAPRPEWESVAFPLLVALNLPKGANRIAAGAHFLPIHFEWRTAKPGIADARTPARGTDGGNLVVKAPLEPMAFAFRSEGGAGQRRAPKWSGGRSSRSEIDAEKAGDWVSDLGGKNIPKLGGNLFFRPNLRLGQVEEMLANAEQTKGGRVTLYVVDSFLDVLTAAQLSKMEAACESEIGKKPDRPALIGCIEKTWLPKALNQLVDHVAAQKKAGKGANDVLPISDALHIFTTVPGADGPENSDGAPGKSGNYRFDRTEVR